MSDKKNYTSKMRTIITNAVCGRTTQTCHPTVYIPSENSVEPTQVLGCTITNAEIQESKFENFTNNSINIKVEGEFVIHVWYETSGDTIVSKSKVKFSEVIPVESLEEEKYHKKSILSRIIKNPTCIGTMIVNKDGTPSIAIQVEYEIGIEVIGEARVNILSYKLEDKKKNIEIILDSVPREEFEFDSNNYDDVD